MSDPTSTTATGSGTAGESQRGRYGPGRRLAGPAAGPAAGRVGAGAGRARRPLGLIVLAGLLLAIGVGWAGWAALANANPPVRATVVSYRVVSDHRIEVQYEVTKHRGATATCAVVARNRVGQPVARSEVSFPAAITHALRTETLTTTDRAVTAETQECRLLGR